MEVKYREGRRVDGGSRIALFRIASLICQVIPLVCGLIRIDFLPLSPPRLSQLRSYYLCIITTRDLQVHNSQKVPQNQVCRDR